ncbi:MAG TPA: SpoIID/LytB domain-containing protein [Acidimicrobiales bacterium]|nr:SpoIID/LytB domain-containing protein [Acidimicrobiales bacterium]
MRHPPRALLAALASLAFGVGLPPAGAQPGPAPEVVISGRGWGHGVGMAQDGAYWMGVAGASTQQILNQFYPGTSIGRRGGTVRVDVFTSAGPATIIELPGGGEIRDAESGPQSAGFPVKLGPGARVRFALVGGRYQVTAPDGGRLGPAPAPAPAPPAAGPPPPPPPPPTTTTTRGGILGLLPPPPPSSRPQPPPARPAPGATAPPPTAPAIPTSGRGLWAVPAGVAGVPEQGRRYRGTLQASAAGGGLRLINHIDVEQYLRGMGEVLEPGWPQASLRAQAVAARTYALRAGGGTICNTQQCQVYLGQQAEYGAMDRAVAATRGQVLVHGGALAEAVYSANAGGVSATPEEGFGPGSPSPPYLRAAPYTTQNPDPWTVRVGVAELAARLGYPGGLSGVRVSREGPSGRALEVTLEGDAGPVTVDGKRFATTLSLRSTLFTLAVEAPAAPPDPPAGGQPAPEAAAPEAAAAAGGVAARATTSLGRAPWIALALLLLAGWGLGARRVTSRAPSR